MLESKIVIIYNILIFFYAAMHGSGERSSILMTNYLHLKYFGSAGDTRGSVRAFMVVLVVKCNVYCSNSHRLRCRSGGEAIDGLHVADAAV
jgi:hypothetical protein